MAKTLPIQFVKTREKQDVFLKEAGGSNELPQWATQQIIQENSIRIVNALENISTHFQNRSVCNRSLPLLVKAKLNKHATAKSYRPNIRSILNQNHKHNVIGISGFGEILFKIDKEEDADAIKNAVVSVQNNTSSKDKPIGVAAIEDLSIYTCPVNAESLSNKLIKVQLVDYKDENYNTISIQTLTRLCGELGCEIKKVNYADNLNIFKVNCPSAETIRQIATLDSVISIKEMPYYELVAAPNPYKAEIELAKPIEGVDYPIIGILDSGVEQSEYLSSWNVCDENNIAGLDESDISRIHGSMVASIAVYGDILENRDYIGCGPLKFISCIVNTDSQGTCIYEDELVEHIRSAVQLYPDIKIWNLSQGSKTEVSDFEFSDFAIALDDIQRKNDILICKSAGNTNGTPGRITLGAESILAFTVGSICNKGFYSEDLDEGSHSPFSRIGYGPEGLIKPEIVHYGGNTRTGIKVLTGFDYQQMAFGTSFSTPRITSLAAHLYHRIGGTFDPTLIKALIIHNANYPLLVDKNIDDYDKKYGFGLPPSINDILNNDEDEFTMVWQPDFSNGTDFQVIDFPYPEILIDENGFYYGEVTVTVVNDPVLKSEEGNEYCQTDIDVKVGPVSKVSHYTLGAVGTPKTYRNEDRVSINNILTEDKYSKCQLGPIRERNLIMKNHKWQPVKKFHVDLSAMTPGRKESIKDFRRWAMTMRALSRDATTLELHEDGLVNPIRTTIIITIKDSKHKGQMYNEGIKLIDIHNFEHSNIITHNYVRILGNIENQ